MRDIYNNIDIVNAIDPEGLKVDETSSAIDLQGYESAEVVIHVGVGGITFSDTNKVEFKLTHSDNDSDYAAVDEDDVEGIDSVGTGGIIHSLIAAHASATVTEVGYIGGKRYLKLHADFSGTHGTATPMAATVVKGHALQS
jgi:hypothetical protein